RRSRRCSGSGTWGSAARRSGRESADARPRWRTRRCRWRPGRCRPAPGCRPGPRVDVSLLEQLLIERRQLLTPDALIDGADVLVANDAVLVDQEGFRRAVHAQVEAQLAPGVLDVEAVGVAQLDQPAARGVAVVLVVDAVHRHAPLGQAVEH